ncbi:hypothetical protein GCM10022240_27490 [Microbacterium kribbense]|uniref:LysR substrate-binding domain-containing protein n=1 Tax=Microbacterium kribbense TaxID=433645 RepID=A0ABP7GRQ3_9MICO
MPKQKPGGSRRSGVKPPAPHAGRAGKGGKPTGKNGKATSPGKRGTAGGPRAPKASVSAAASTSLPEGPFRLGVIPGAMPGKWIDTWNERMPHNRLELVPIPVAAQFEALDAGDVDAALVRLPIDGADLHVIALYDEVPVVVMPAESHLTAADELEPADLAGEVLIVPADDVLGFRAPGAQKPRFGAPATTEDAVAIVASGVGIVVVPMSLARLHHRKDTEYRPLRDAPISTVALAWPAGRDDPLADVFVGIVRGRTANSSR